MVRQITLCLLLLLYSPGRAQISAWLDSSAAQLHDIVDETTISNAAYWSTHGFNQIRDIIGMIDTTWAIASNYDNINGAITSLPTASDAGVVLIPYTFADGQSYTKSDSSLILDYRLGNLLRLDGNMALSGALNIGHLAVPNSAIPLHVRTTGDVSPQWLFESQDSRVFGGTLKLRHNSATPATNDGLGSVEWSGDDNLGNNAVFGFMTMLAKNVTDGSEAGEFAWILQNAGTLDSVLVMRSAPNKEIIFNPDSLDYDFRVHSNALANRLVVMGDDGDIGMGAEPEDAINLHIVDAVNGPTLKLENNNADAFTTSLIFEKDGSSPADNDRVGIIDFINEEIIVAGIVALVQDVSAGDVAGSIELSVTMNSVPRNFIFLDGFTGVVDQGKTTFNNASQDIDWNIKTTSNANLVYVDALNDRWGMGTATPTEDFHFTGSAGTENFMIETTDAGTNPATLILFKNTATEADGDPIAEIVFRGRDDGPASRSFARIVAITSDVSASGGFGGDINIDVAVGGTLQEIASFSGYNGSQDQGQIIFNEPGSDIDYRFETDTQANAFVLIGSSAFVGVGTGAPEASMHVAFDDAINTSTTNVLVLDHTTSLTPASAIGVGISFKIEDLGGSEQQGSIGVALTTVTNGSEVADMTFRANGAASAGTVDNFMKWDGSLKSLVITGEIGMNSIQSITLGSSVTTFAVTRNYVRVTGDGGANTIATITAAAIGLPYVFEFVDALVTITDNDAHDVNSVDLSAAFTGADDTILTLAHNGVSWYEVSRSAN